MTNVLTTVKNVLKFIQTNPTITSAGSGLILELLTSGKIDPAALLAIISAIGLGKTVHKKVTTGAVL